MTNAVPGAPATTTAVHLIPVFEAKPGYEHELGRLLSELQNASRRDDGCLEYSVFNDEEAPGTFLLYEKWTSSTALDMHNEQQHVNDFLVAAQHVLARNLRVHRLNPLS
jgi:quinol monooxygenase YgiN